MGVEEDMRTASNHAPGLNSPLANRSTDGTTASN